MRRFFASLTLIGALAIGSLLGQAQMLSTIDFATTGSAAILLGDIQAQTAFYGVVAYNAAEAAAGTQLVFDLQRGRDATATCSPKIGANGVVDLTVGAVCNGNTQTVTAWQGGSNATCTGSITTTTLTVTSCSAGTLAVNDHITGAGGGGVASQTFITAIGTCATPPGTCTIAPSQTVTSTTITAKPPDLFTLTWYDQTAGNKCTSLTCDMVTTNGGTDIRRAPQLLLTGCGISGTLPCLGSTDGSSCCSMLSNNNFTPNASAKFSTSAITSRGGDTFAINIFSWASANRIKTVSSANQIQVTATGSVIGTFTQAWHAVNGVGNGASSVINVDNTETTGTVTANTTAGQVSVNLNSTDLTQDISVAFVDNVTSSAPTRASIATNACKQIGTSC